MTTAYEHCKTFYEKLTSMSKNTIVVKRETLKKLLGLFSDNSECKAFFSDYQNMVQQVAFLEQLMIRNNDHVDKSALVLASILFQIAVFVRGNMDLINEMVAAVEFKTVDEKDVKPEMTVFEKYMGIEVDGTNTAT